MVVTGDYPKKHISKEVTAYNQVFYLEIRRLLWLYSRDKAPSGAFRLPTLPQAAIQLRPFSRPLHLLRGNHHTVTVAS